MKRHNNKNYTKKKVKEIEKQYLYVVSDSPAPYSSPSFNYDGSECLEEVEEIDLQTDFLYLSVNKPDERFFCDRIEVKDKNVFNNTKLYLSVITYSEVDSFNETNGLYHIVGVYASQIMADQAAKLAASSKDSCYPWNHYGAKYSTYDVYELPLKGNNLEVIN